MIGRLGDYNLGVKNKTPVKHKTYRLTSDGKKTSSDISLGLHRIRVRGRLSKSFIILLGSGSSAKGRGHISYTEKITIFFLYCPASTNAGVEFVCT